MDRKISNPKGATIWETIELIDIILLLILSIIGLSLEPLHLMGIIGEIRSTSALLFIGLLLSLLAIGLLLVLRKVEESKKVITSSVSKIEAKLLEDHDAFYKKAEEEVRRAGKSIDVTHFYPLPPSATKIRADNRYFETLSGIIKEDKIMTRRIVSISNKDKYEWVKTTIYDHQNTEKFHVKYNSLVSDDFPLLNVLIFDNKKVFVGIYQEAAVPEKAIFIDNETIATVFSDYYQTLWGKSSDLKSGTRIDEEKLNGIREKIEGGAGR